MQLIFFLKVDCTFFTQVDFTSTVKQIIKSKTFGFHSAVQEYQIDHNSPQLDYTFIVIVRDSMHVQEWKLNDLNLSHHILA